MPRTEYRPPTPSLSVVVPVFEEEAILPSLVERLGRVLDDLGVEAEVLLIDDGSRDGTPLAIRRAHKADGRFTGLSLSRNFGHQIAISAGLAHARGEAVVVMDGDLQDPPEAIPALYERLSEGFDVVYAIRASRPEGPIKRLAYAAFYRLLRRSVSIDIPVDAGDFGILSRRVVDLLNAMPERRRFVRGLRAWVGFRQTGLLIDRAPRHAGRPKFTPRKLAGLALDGLVSFGDAPLRWAGMLGMLAVLGALLGTFFIAARGLLGGVSPTSGAAWSLLALFLGGCQLLSMAILGEYVSRIAQEMFGRPLYVVRSRVGLDPPGRPRRRRRSASESSSAAT